MTFSPTRTGATLAAALLVAHVATADAATAGRSTTQSAAGLCQGALPAFAGTLRARPLGLVNEGTSTAFVTCAQEAGNSGVNTDEVFIRVANTANGSSVATIQCTFVEGFGDGFTHVWWPHSVTLTAHASAAITVSAYEMSMTSLTNSQWSCALPPNTAIYYLGRSYSEEVGD